MLPLVADLGERLGWAVTLHLYDTLSTHSKLLPALSTDFCVLLEKTVSLRRNVQWSLLCFSLHSLSLFVCVLQVKVLKHTAALTHVGSRSLVKY